MRIKPEGIFEVETLIILTGYCSLAIVHHLLEQLADHVRPC